MNALVTFFGAVIDGIALVALVAVALVVANFRSVATWVRDRWTEFTDLPASTTVDRMVREVKRRERGGLL
jgi:Flp pilus assembly pilin Flp